MHLMQGHSPGKDPSFRTSNASHRPVPLFLSCLGGFQIEHKTPEDSGVIFTVPGGWKNGSGCSNPAPCPVFGNRPMKISSF